jgi:CRISPR-associated protein Cas5d
VKGIRIIIEGERACFSRPELKVERVSYDVITPSAARGILEAVFWKPAIKYIIDEIAICAPIKFENIRRNEVNSKASTGKAYIAASDDRAQRASMILKDVRYVVTAHFEPVDEKLGDGDKLPDGKFNHGKFADILTRRLRNGQNYYMPYLGTREFPAYVSLLEEDDGMPRPIADSRSLGLMLYDMDYERDADGNVTEFISTYFRAEIKQGVIDLRGVEVLR